MSFSLRPYQTDMVERTRQLIYGGARTILECLPTGGGKTALTGYMLKSASEKGNRCWFIVHRRELVRQSASTFHRVGLNHGIIASGFPSDPRQIVQVCSIDSLRRRLDRIEPPKVIVWDECHHVGAKSWADVHASFPDAIHIGLSATPERLDGLGLGQWFETMVVGPSVRDLIADGFLAPYRLFAPSGIDVSGVRTRAGDFAQDEVAKIMDKPAITGDAVSHYQRLSAGRRAVVFCCSIQHSEHVARAFNDAGIPSAHLDGETDNTLRDETIKKFERGEIMVLSNVGLFSEGFDLPAIETCILLRPTQSVSMYLQQCGRALRPCDGKVEALILDHAGNSGRHGLPDDVREWSLQGRGKRTKKNQDDGPPVRTCMKCFAALSISAKTCNFCGYPVEIKERDIEWCDGELEEVQRREERKQQIRAQARAESLDDLIAIGRSRGFKRPELWARHVFMARQAKRQMIGTS